MYPLGITEKLPNYETRLSLLLQQQQHNEFTVAHMQTHESRGLVNERCGPDRWRSLLPARLLTDGKL